MMQFERWTELKFILFRNQQPFFFNGRIAIIPSNIRCQNSNPLSCKSSPLITIPWLFARESTILICLHLYLTTLICSHLYSTTWICSHLYCYSSFCNIWLNLGFLVSSYQYFLPILIFCGTLCIIIWNDVKPRGPLSSCSCCVELSLRLLRRERPRSGHQFGRQVGGKPRTQVVIHPRTHWSFRLRNNLKRTVFVLVLNRPNFSVFKKSPKNIIEMVKTWLCLGFF